MNLDKSQEEELQRWADQFRNRALRRGLRRAVLNFLLSTRGSPLNREEARAVVKGDVALRNEFDEWLADRGLFNFMSIYMNTLADTASVR